MAQPASLPRAIGRGFAMKCPTCGRGHLFRRFLKVADHCEICSEDFTPQRADDFPAYLVIVVVGHIVVPALLAVAVAYDPPAWLQRSEERRVGEEWGVRGLRAQWRKD